MPLSNPETTLTDIFGNPITGSLPLAISGTVQIAGEVSINNFPAVQAVSGGIVVQNWPAVHGVSGTVGVNNFPGVQAVSGVISIGNWPAIHGVSGTVGVNNFPATQNISGTVGASIQNWPATLGVSASAGARWFVETTGSMGLQVGNGPYDPMYVSVTSSLPVTVTNTITLGTTGSQGLQVGNAPYDEIYVTPGIDLFAVQIQAEDNTSFSPDPGNDVPGTFSNLNVDAIGNLEVRGQVTTDEGTFRDDFIGSNLATNLAGTTSFTSGSILVNGVGTSFTSLTTDYYIKVASQSDDFYTRISQINSDTQLELVKGYPGATAAGVLGAFSHWGINAAGTGAVTVNSSNCVLSPGTAANGSITLTHIGDFLPYTLLFRASLTQRVANQTTTLGFQDSATAPAQQAIVVFDGATNTTARFVTSASPAAADLYTQTFTLPNGLTTVTPANYQIDLSNNVAILSINGVAVASSSVHLPNPYTDLTLVMGMVNTAIVTNTTCSIDLVLFSNLDQVQITNSFIGELIKVAPGIDSSGTPHQILTDAVGTTIVTGSLALAGTVTVVQPSAANLNVNAVQGTGTLANAWFEKITDGTNTAAVKAASTAAVAADPALVVAVNPFTPISGTVVDRSAMVPGSQTGTPVMGQSSGVGRLYHTNRLGHHTPGYQTVLAQDLIEGSVVNSWLWTQSTTTMTIAVASGLLTLNAGAITTTTTDAIITSTRQFPIVNQCQLGCSFKALVSQTTNAVQELGFGAPVGTTAIVQNGAFFRISNSGQISCVISSAGVETATVVSPTISGTTYYVFLVWLTDTGARFVIESSSGVPLVDTTIVLPVGTPTVASAVSHVPVFARVYTTGAAGAAPQTKIASFQVWQWDIDNNKSWAEQLAMTGRTGNVNPTTFAQTLQLAAGAAPTATTPTNTTCAYATLGGEFLLNATAASENLLGVFGFQVPTPYTFVVTDIVLPPPVVSTALAAVTIHEYTIMVGSNNNPSTATGFRYPLAIFSALATAVAGTIFSGQLYGLSLKTPIVLMPGQFLMVMVKVIAGSASGAYRGSILLNGYYE